MARIKDFVNSIILNGGGTYNMTTHELNPTHGYSVGVKTALYVADNPIGECVHDFLRNHREYIFDDLWIGAWVNDDLLHMDLVKIVEDISEAQKLARDHEQLSFWDNANKKEIWV